jgi:hypothetical protein
MSVIEVMRRLMCGAIDGASRELTDIRAASIPPAPPKPLPPVVRMREVTQRDWNLPTKRVESPYIDDNRRNCRKTF